MLKRNTNLLIKLLLIVLLTILFMSIFRAAEATAIDSHICENEYCYAAQTWEYFTERNFSEAATAGILGNMMIETAGGTLDLKPYVYSPSGNYFGLCQWSVKLYSGARDLPFEYQLDYLLGTMPWEFNTFGWLYKKNFNFEDFIKMTNPEEAAIAFAKSYERCSQNSYKLRQQAAKKAYEYFIKCR